MSADEWLVILNRTDQRQTLNLLSGQWHIAQPFSVTNIDLGDTKCIASPRSISVLRNRNQQI